MQQLTKQLIQEHMGIYLIKVAEKKEYIDDLLAGNIYMKESGYFRKLEDCYRGDCYDGRRPIDIGDEIAYLENPETGERLYLNGVPGVQMTNFNVGFEGDDKIPIFCAFMMDADVIEITGEDSFCIKPSYLQELAQFGQYVAFIPLGEMMMKLDEYGKQHRDIAFFTGKVAYMDIMKEYSADQDDDDELGKYRAFFNKDMKYAKQNEWRIVALGREKLINETMDHWKVNVGAFQYAVGMEMDDLLKGEFHIGERDE